MMAFSKRMLGSLAARKTQLALAVRVAVAAVAAYAIAHGAASDAAAMGGADLADRHPDERRPVAEGDPRLHARHGRRRDLWRRHRGADPAFRRGRLAGAAGAGGRAAGLHRRHQSQPERRHGDGRDRAAGSDHEPRQSAGFRDRSRHRGHRRRAHRARGLVPGAAVAGDQPDPRQCGARCWNCSPRRSPNCWRA